MKKPPSCNRCKRKRSVRQRPLCLFCLVRLRKLARTVAVGLDDVDTPMSRTDIELVARELAEMVRQL